MNNFAKLNLLKNFFSATHPAQKASASALRQDHHAQYTINLGTAISKDGFTASPSLSIYQQQQQQQLQQQQQQQQPQHKSSNNNNNSSNLATLNTMPIQHTVQNYLYIKTTHPKFSNNSFTNTLFSLFFFKKKKKTKKKSTYT